jgi:hypothetical protein
MKIFMKLFVLIFAVSLVSISYAQVKGETKPGRILFKKDVKPEEGSPEIVLLQPVLSGKEISLDDKSVKVKGIVNDKNGIRDINVNGIQVPFDNGSFSADVPLNEGLNKIIITATNNNYKSSELSFNVRKGSDTFGPTITIVEPSVTRGIKIIRKSEVTTVRGIAIDPSGILKVVVNNQTAELFDNGEFKIDLFLEMGENTITVEALDGKLNSSKNIFNVTRELADVITGGKYIGVVIGINSYEGYWHPLKNAVNDAKGMVDILKSKYHFDAIYTLFDKEATRRNIIQQFETLTRDVSKDDNVLIFYAGHGQYNKALNKGYWVPVDATSNSVADYISNNDIKTFLGGIPSKHTLLITDACFAGDVFRGSPTESISFDPNNMERYYREVYRKQSRLALTSGGVEEVMDAGKENHSIFTYYLLKALNENNRKYMDANQLFNEFRIAVTNNSEQTPMLQVVRDTNDEGGQFIFIKK